MGIAEVLTVEDSWGVSFHWATYVNLSGHGIHLQTLKTPCRLLEPQHEHTNPIVSTPHVHRGHDDCLEVIALRGPAPKLQELADWLKGLKESGRAN